MIYTLIKRDPSSDAVVSTYSFNCVRSFNDKRSASVSTEIVEQGYGISDNITIDNPTFSIEATLTGYSIYEDNFEVVWDGEDFVQASDSEVYINYVQRAKATLLELFESRSLISILESESNSFSSDNATKETELKRKAYDEISSCVMTGIDFSFAPSATEALYVSMSFVKVRFAKVSFSELTDAEMLPALIPLKKQTQSVSSKTSEKEAPTSGNPDNKGADKNSAAKDTKTADGILSSEDGLAQARVELAPLEKEAENLQRAIEISSMTPRQVLVGEASSNFSIGILNRK